MKILYAIQGTGNGHISRARDIIPELQKYGSVDVLISGVQADVTLDFPVKYRLHGCSFVFGKKGGISMLETAKVQKPLRLLKDIRQLPVNDYDIVISDFEPISVWACKLRKKKVYGLSHQCAVLDPKAKLPDGNMDLVGAFVLKYYAPSDYSFGFYFYPIDNRIFPAVIRNEIRDLKTSDYGHYTVYLPSYSDEALFATLSKINHIQWHIFSKHTRKAYTKGNTHYTPVENNAFLKSIATCKGVLMGAGFEGPCEALFLGKKLMVIPMKAQYEQQCNAAGLAHLGVPVIPELNSTYLSELQMWVNETSKTSAFNFSKDTAANAVSALIEHFKKHL